MNGGLAGLFDAGLIGGLGGLSDQRPTVYAVEEARSAFEDLVDERKKGTRSRDWVAPVLVSRVLLAAQGCEGTGRRALSGALCDWIKALDEPSWVEAALRERVEAELR